MSENSIEFSLSNSEQRDSWLNSSHRTLDADIRWLCWGLEHPLVADIQEHLMQWNICCKPCHHWSWTYQKRCTLLDQYPQRFASALSQWGVSEILDQKYDLWNSVTEIILRGEEGGTHYSCMEEQRLCIQHLVIEIRQEDAIIVTRTYRLSPNRHLLGISTELADLMILLVIFVWTQWLILPI